MKEQIKELAKEMPLRFVRKHIKGILKVQYRGGSITKQQYKSGKKLLKNMIREIANG